jgi:pimeloyl-ACP methyl ester carboxylesterase
MIRARVPHRAGDLTAAGGGTCLPIVLKSCPGQLPDPGGVQLRPSGRLGALVDVELRAVCDWPATAANPYAGPLNRPTARPILVVNPTFDPATSYQAAEAMVRELADARLLTLEGYGHTTLGNPSTCINEHVSRYLIDGILPPVGATCAQDEKPFTPSHP